MDADQLHYMQTVLGISSIVMPKGLTPALPSQAMQEGTLCVRMRGSVAQARLVVFWARSDGGEGAAEILAQKMTAAMKVEMRDVLWIEWDSDPLANLPPEILEIPPQVGRAPILVFGSLAAERLLPTIQNQYGQSNGHWLEYRGARYLVTLSPEELLASADKKRLAWTHLQAVMKEL